MRLDKRTTYSLAALILIIGLNPCVTVEADADYSTVIRPLLARHCFACHGPDEAAREADLRLDIRDAAIAAGAIVPGESEQSSLIERVTATDPEIRMPPGEHSAGLNANEVLLLSHWIQDGAEYSEHWAFVRPEAGELPSIRNHSWPKTDIDLFVLAGIEEAGWQPAADADPAVWLRRVALDLTGLPPSLELAARFLAQSPIVSEEQVVEELLQSPHYGERWAAVWLDLARYADTRGYEKDRHRDIWRYRDWVIEAFNNDMPFDRFTELQLAGDLIVDPTDESILATAFHRNTMTNEEGGTDNEEFRVAAVKDRVDTTLQVWMGLTAGCAKCHSHKYDPIRQTEYYQFYSYFNQTADADAEVPVRRTPTADQERQLDKLESRLSEAKRRAASEQVAELETARAALLKTFPQTPVMQELAPARHRNTHVHVRGNFLDPGAMVEPAVPAAFGPFPADAPANRLGVAHWLMHKNNPLTARVTVNRIWARLFGRGIVETEEDFGTQGSLPTHPQLLDHLAVRFREEGWSIKSLLRRLVLSRTYRQQTTTSPEILAQDPNNRLLARMSRVRLPAESVRDQALASSGLLVRQIGGPSVMPPQPDGIWKSTYSGENWKTAADGNRYRRAVYTYKKRTSPYPSFLTFDAGSGEICQIRRIRTNTPLQALVTLNDPVYLEAAAALGARMKESAGPVEEQIRTGFRRLLIRMPTPEELDRLLAFYRSAEAQSANPALLLTTFGDSGSDLGLTLVAHVLLNLDEALVRP